MPQPSRRIAIKPRAPFRLDLTAWALRRRPHNAIDRFSAGVYRRALAFDGAILAVSVRQVGPPRDPMLEVEIGGHRVFDQGVDGVLRGAIERLLGTDVDLSGFRRLTRKDPVLGPLA